MGEHRRRYPALPAGHFHVIDQDGRDTYWSVDHAGRLRDYPPGQRWRPLPPPKPDDVPDEERNAWREQWYEDVYWTYKNAIAEAISEDPLAAAHRFRDKFATAEIPDPPSKPRRRERQRRPKMPSALQQRRAAEALAAYALAEAGMSVRSIAGTLEVPRMTAWRRLNNGDSATRAVTSSTLLGRVDSLQASLLAELLLSPPERRGEVVGLIRDLREAVRNLTRRDGAE